MFERLTDALAEKAWAFFQDVEKQGGMAEALRSGLVSFTVTCPHSSDRRLFESAGDPAPSWAPVQPSCIAGCNGATGRTAETSYIAAGRPVAGRLPGRSRGSISPAASLAA